MIVMRTREVSFWYWVVSCLPKKLIYFCAMHVMVRVSTSPEYCNVAVPELYGMDALTWYEKFEVGR